MKKLFKTNIFYSLLIIGIIFFDVLCVGAQEYGDIPQVGITPHGVNSFDQNAVNPEITIECEDISDNGHASAYFSYKFFIKESNLPIVDPTWTLKMTLKDGSIENVNLQDNGLSCTTPIIENEDRYKINVDGDIEAQLQFSCMLNGKEEKTIPFKIDFGLKPLIEYAVIEKIVDHYPYASYDAHYKVKYRGADIIEISLEEEYGGAVRSWYSREPYVTYGIVTSITSPFCAWIDFEARNKYGKSLYTIELGPYGEVVGIDDVVINQTDDQFEVYNLHGIFIGRFERIEEVRQIHLTGLVIVKHLRNNKIVEIIKMTI